MNRAKLRLSVLNDVSKERDRQNRPQRHDYKTWLTILVDEVEVVQAMQSEMGWGKPTDANNLYEELIHVAAVSVAIAEQIKELEN